MLETYSVFLIDSNISDISEERERERERERGEREREREKERESSENSKKRNIFGEKKKYLPSQWTTIWCGQYDKKSN